jgi:hypothetical protein
MEFPEGNSKKPSKKILGFTDFADRIFMPKAFEPMWQVLLVLHLFLNIYWLCEYPWVIFVNIN